MNRKTGDWRDVRTTEALPVLVVFSDQTDLPWLHILKRGYRHCFLAIFQGSRWLIYDPLVHRTEIAALDLPPDFNLADWYRQHGLRVIATEILPAPMISSSFSFWASFPLRPFTCVEAVKRVLGIRAAGVFTPRTRSPSGPRGELRPRPSVIIFITGRTPRCWQACLRRLGFPCW